MGAQGQRRQRGRTHKERWHFPEAGPCGSSAPRRPADGGFVPGLRAGSSLVAGPRPQARGPWARRTHPGMVVGGAGARPRTSQGKHKGLGTASLLSWAEGPQTRAPSPGASWGPSPSPALGCGRLGTCAVGAQSPLLEGGCSRRHTRPSASPPATTESSATSSPGGARGWRRSVRPRVHCLARAGGPREVSFRCLQPESQFLLFKRSILISLTSPSRTGHWCVPAGGRAPGVSSRRGRRS